MDREIRDITREETKVKREVKILARKGQVDAVRPLARELVRSRKAKERIYTAKAQLNSVGLTLRQQAHTMQMAENFKMSTGIMKSMGKLVDMYAVNETMRDMAYEMEKAGLIQEMMDDTIDGVMDQDGMDEEADAQVDQVLTELTMGILGNTEIGVVPTKVPHTKEQLAETAKELLRESLAEGDHADAEADDNVATDSLQKRLAMLHA